MSGIRPFGLWLYLVIGFAIAFRYDHWHKECHGAPASDFDVVALAIGWSALFPAAAIASIGTKTPPLHCEARTP